ncbi:MAG TPA: hypothetical protein VLS25_03150, partial [Dehalococcoidia bacterium]|nr:hypothetical protein [Dehalococcoidia bacterium]
MAGQTPQLQIALTPYHRLQFRQQHHALLLARVRPRQDRYRLLALARVDGNMRNTGRDENVVACVGRQRFCLEAMPVAY